MFGLCLQEPMALITNWLIAITSFILYRLIKSPQNEYQRHWKFFYLIFGISTFFGGLGHVLFNYFDVYGKFPCWFFGTIAAYHAGCAMINVSILSPKLIKKLKHILIIKAVVFGLIAFVFQSFLFIMVDATITYLFFCLGFGAYYWRKGIQSFKYTVFAVLILFPSIFIFALKINPHLWFNKDDLSHVLMVTTIIFFYFSIANSSNGKISLNVELNKKKENVQK